MRAAAKSRASEAVAICGARSNRTQPEQIASSRMPTSSSTRQHRTTARRHSRRDMPIAAPRLARSGWRNAFAIAVPSRCSRAATPRLRCDCRFVVFTPVRDRRPFRSDRVADLSPFRFDRGRTASRLSSTLPIFKRSSGDQARWKSPPGPVKHRGRLVVEQTDNEQPLSGRRQRCQSRRKSRQPLGQRCRCVPPASLPNHNPNIDRTSTQTIGEFGKF